MGIPDHLTCLLCGSAGKESACYIGYLGSIPGLGRSPGGEGKVYPLQYFGLEKSTDCIVHGVPKSRTRLSDFHFHFTDLPPEKSIFRSKSNSQNQTQNNGLVQNWEIILSVTDFIFLGSKIIADGDCSHEINLLLRRKATTNLDSTLKSRDINLPTKVHVVKAVVFPVVMYRCES